MTTYEQSYLILAGVATFTSFWTLNYLPNVGGLRQLKAVNCLPNAEILLMRHKLNAQILITKCWNI